MAAVAAWVCPGRSGSSYQPGCKVIFLGIRRSVCGKRTLLDNERMKFITLIRAAAFPLI